MTEHRVEGFALSPPQQRAWNAAARSRDQQPTVGLVARVTGHVDADRVQTALAAVIAAEEILRTRFEELPGTRVPVQVVDAPWVPDLKRADLSEVASRSRPAALEALLEKLADVPFDLGRADLLRTTWARLGEAEHALLLVQPAIVADERSLWNLCARVVEHLAGAEPGADPDHWEYADLAQWQLDHLHDSEGREALARWQALELEPARAATLGLETGRTRSERTLRPHERTLALESSGLTRAARVEGVSLEALLLAAWSALLAKHAELAHDADPIVAVASPGRDFEGLSEALGPFRRFLPTRVRLGDDDLFGVARALERALAEARERHEACDLERLLSRARGLHVPWGFEYCLEESALVAAGLRVAYAFGRSDDEAFLARLRCRSGQDGVVATLAFDPTALEDSSAALLLEQLATLLNRALATPTAPLAAIDPASDAERARVAGLARGPLVPALDDAETVLALLARGAEAAGDAPAVVGATRTVSRADLEREATRLALRLAARGVGPGTLVALAVERSPEAVIALYAVLQAGAAYLPLSLALPDDRFTAIVADTAARFVLARAADAGRLPRTAAQALVLEELVEDVDAQATLTSPSGTDPAYVITTSGSTGRPKAVVVTHENLLASTAARLQHYARRPESYLLSSSLAFDSSVAGLFWTLASGGKLVLPATGDERDPAALLALIEGERCTHLLCLPAVWSALLAAGKGRPLPALTTVIVAGESVPRRLVDTHFEERRGVALWNEYGPTEATVWGTVHDCSEHRGRALVPIGRPIPGAFAWVLDATHRPTPLGIAGELFLGGAGISPGYLGQPALTAERFVRAPWNPRQRLYATGDRARMLPDGTLEFLGRRDLQVKVRGYRIELEEIEAALARDERLSECVVAARPDARGDARLVAWLVPAPGLRERPPAAELREALARTLPDWMLPSAFVWNDALPRLANGKLDRAALPEPAGTRQGLSRPFAPPRTALERVLALLFGEVLGVTEVGRDDDFFELGGHSIAATRLFARLVELLRSDLSLRELFAHRSVARLAGRLSTGQDGARVARIAEVVLEVLAGDEDAEEAA